MEKVYVENLKNAGCNNGNYPKYEIRTGDRVVKSGITCRCGAGCMGTDRTLNNPFGGWLEEQ